MSKGMSSDLMFSTGQDVQPAHPSWYRGDNCNFNPTKRALAAEGGLEEFILKGWLPPQPFISRDMPITAFGSCFAQNISRWLMRQQYATGDRLAFTRHGTHLNTYDSHVVRFGEGIVNTFALRQQFEWALEGKRFSEDLWFGSRGELAAYSDEARDHTRELFLRSEVFILTLGLSEVWCNTQTGEVFWRAIPRDKFDASRHGFRVSTVAENLENLEAIHAVIRKHRPSASIVITLSPIPLVATFRPVSCLTANSVSKAILRVAVDELMRAHRDDRQLYYWPSYEIVKDYVVDAYLDDNRHPRADVIAMIMRSFASHYLIAPYSDEQMEDKVARARASFGQIEALPSAVHDTLIELGILDHGTLAEVPEPLMAELIGNPGTAASVRQALARSAA